MQDAVPHSDKSGKVYFIVGLFLTLLIWGLQLIGVTVNIWLGGFVLAISFALMVYAFWIWEGVSRWHVLLRLGTIAGAAILFVFLIGKQITAERRREHLTARNVPAVPPTSPPAAPAAPVEQTPKPQPKPQQEQKGVASKGGSNSPKTGAITTGPCSNVQVGGSKNQATTNCNEPPQVTASAQTQKKRECSTRLGKTCLRSAQRHWFRRGI